MPVSNLKDHYGGSTGFGKTNTHLGVQRGYPDI